MSIKYNKKTGHSLGFNRNLVDVPTKKEVKKMIKNNNKAIQELKHRTVTYDSTVDLTMLFQSLTAITQGDQDVNRQGSVIEPKSIELNLSFNSVDTFNLLRVIVFQWFMDDGDDPPTNTDILDYQHPLGVIAWHERKNSRILYDKLMAGSDTASNEILVIRKKINKKMRKIYYDGGLTTGKNNLYLALISDSGVASHPNVKYYARVLYTDS